MGNKVKPAKLSARLVVRELRIRAKASFDEIEEAAADHIEKLARELKEARALLAAHPGQPEPRAEVTDDQIAAMFERVTGYSIENGRAALNDADILGFARELLEAARAGDSHE